MTGRVVVVGAGLAGVRAVEELRRTGFDGPITLLGAERHLPYDRPPLSKEVLRGEKTMGDVRLREDQFFAERDIDLRLGVRAVGLDRQARKVELDVGPALEYEHLVVATGITPRWPGFVTGHDGVHVLRGADDVLALREDADSARSVLVVGAGFIGCEVAAGFRALERDVVLVEPQAAPLAGALGPTVGELVGRLHSTAGVDLRCGVGVSELQGADRVSGAQLTDGGHVEADVVVCGVGSSTATGWLEESGLELADGVVCDESGRTSDPHVWAIGDVAAWQRPSLSGHWRVEHWTSASEQAAVVAREIGGVPAASQAPSVPYFWSDQYGLKIQALGHIEAGDDVEVRQDDGRKFAAIYSRDGVLTGAVGAGMPGRVMKLRPLIAREALVGELDAE